MVMMTVLTCYLLDYYYLHYCSHCYCSLVCCVLHLPRTAACVLALHTFSFSCRARAPFTTHALHAACSAHTLAAHTHGGLPFGAHTHTLRYLRARMPFHLYLPPVPHIYIYTPTPFCTHPYRHFTFVLCTTCYIRSSCSFVRSRSVLMPRLLYSLPSFAFILVRHYQLLLAVYFQFLRDITSCHYVPSHWLRYPHYYWLYSYTLNASFVTPFMLPFPLYSIWLCHYVYTVLHRVRHVHVHLVPYRYHHFGSLPLSYTHFLHTFRGSLYCCGVYRMVLAVAGATRPRTHSVCSVAPFCCPPFTSGFTTLCVTLPGSPQPRHATLPLLALRAALLPRCWPSLRYRRRCGSCVAFYAYFVTGLVKLRVLLPATFAVRFCCFTTALAALRCCTTFTLQRAAPLPVPCTRTHARCTGLPLRLVAAYLPPRVHLPLRVYYACRDIHTTPLHLFCYFYCPFAAFVLLRLPAPLFPFYLCPLWLIGDFVYLHAFAPTPPCIVPSPLPLPLPFPSPHMPHLTLTPFPLPLFPFHHPSPPLHASPCPLCPHIYLPLPLPYLPPYFIPPSPLPPSPCLQIGSPRAFLAFTSVRASITSISSALDAVLYNAPVFVCRRRHAFGVFAVTL